jgi:RimJ/RimL family protein N-acetyltransferase
MNEDKDWLVETANDPEVAKYAICVYPATENEVEESLKKELEEGKGRHIVAELDGEPAGNVSIWFREEGGRDRHVAWLGIHVRRKHWGKGVGSALMTEAIRYAKELGCRRLMLGTTEGNERAMRLYQKFGFRTEAFENDEVYVDGSWRENYIMGLDLASCEPKADCSHGSQISPAKSDLTTSNKNVQVRQLLNHDLDEVNRLQNCPESTKSSFRIPPITKEETKRWYKTLDTEKDRYCLACFLNNMIRGYLQFRPYRLPFPCLKFEEIIVDINQEPYETAKALTLSVKGFMSRYWYKKVFAYVPETSFAIVSALEENGFSKTGAMKCYYYVSEYYVDSAVYEYPPNC